MKSVLRLAAAAAVLVLAASCNKEASVSEKEVPVTMNITLPEIGTKAIADGQSVNQVRCVVYRNGRLISHADVTKTITMTGGQATYTTRLISGQTYNIVFWAEVAGNTHYTVDYNTATVTVSYASAAGNDETRDAFFNAIEYQVTDANSTLSVTLKRPFAQLNYGLSDADKALADAISPIAKAQVSLDGGAYTKLNLSTGEVSVPATAPVVFTSAPIITSETLKVQPAGTATPTEYTYLSMNYILVNQEVTPNAVLTLYDASNAEVTRVNTSLVPLKRNYRTNIVGNLISEPATINIVVDPAFNTPDEIVTY
ncbi:MAG: DUF6562 domain-containing protein [Candidatus Cryptobacteroides sp.]